jgi:hypothetical protein
MVKSQINHGQAYIIFQINSFFVYNLSLYVICFYSKLIPEWTVICVCLGVFYQSKVSIDIKPTF